jgi:hypothetical protein
VQTLESEHSALLQQSAAQKSENSQQTDVAPMHGLPGDMHWPLAGLQTSGPLQNCPSLGQLTGEFWQAPLTQVSVVQLSPSLQSAFAQHSETHVSEDSQHVPVGGAQGLPGDAHMPVAGLQASIPLQKAPSPGHVTGGNWQTPETQASVVQRSPSSQSRSLQHSSSHTSAASQQRPVGELHGFPGETHIPVPGSQTSVPSQKTLLLGHVTCVF